MLWHLPTTMLSLAQIPTPWVLSLMKDAPLHHPHPPFLPSTFLPPNPTSYCAGGWSYKPEIPCVFCVWITDTNLRSRGGIRNLDERCSLWKQVGVLRGLIKRWLLLFAGCFGVLCLRRTWQNFTAKWNTWSMIPQQFLNPSCIQYFTFEPCKWNKP